MKVRFEKREKSMFLTQTISFSGKDTYKCCTWSPCGQFIAALMSNSVEIQNQLTFELLTVLKSTEYLLIWSSAHLFPQWMIPHLQQLWWHCNLWYTDWWSGQKDIDRILPVYSLAGVVVGWKDCWTLALKGPEGKGTRLCSILPHCTLHLTWGNSWGELLEEMMGERGREVIIVNVLLDRYIYYCVTCDNNNYIVVMVA